MESPNFSSFRQLMDTWDASKKIFEENDLCLFLKKDGVIYGATEDSRITFARMKNPADEDKEWAKEATFTVYDLEKSQDGKKVMGPLMGLKDVKKIVPMDEKEAEKELKKKGMTIPVIQEDDDEGVLGEK